MTSADIVHRLKLVMHDCRRKCMQCTWLIVTFLKSSTVSVSPIDSIKKPSA